SKASCPAAPTPSAPASISPSPTARTRSRPAVQSRFPRSFDVLHLFPQFLDFRFDLQRDSRDCQGFAFHAGRLGKHGVRLALHFLEQEIEFLAEFAGAVQQLRKLLQMAAQSV